MHGVIEIISWMLVSIVKFLFTPGAMIASGYGFWQTATITMAGASVGVLIFYFGGEAIFRGSAKLRSKKRKKPVRKFTRRNRIIIRIKNRFGVVGLSALIGVLSVPLCTLLAARYFHHNKRTVFVLILSVIIWALSLTAFSYIIRFLLS